MEDLGQRNRMAFTLTPPPTGPCGSSRLQATFVVWRDSLGVICVK